MSAGTTVVVIIAAVIIVAVIAISALAASRRRRLRQRFGPEYDRAVNAGQSKRKAEAELASRERRVRSLDIRPLTPAAKTNYTSRWASIQERFVDQPEAAVSEAQRLVTVVLGSRGYPTEGHDQMLADLSVGHASNLEHYRAALAISYRATTGSVSTEDLRQAMIHYRVMFNDLLGGMSNDLLSGSLGQDSEPAAVAGPEPGGPDSVTRNGSGRPEPPTPGRSSARFGELATGQGEHPQSRKR